MAQQEKDGTWAPDKSYLHSESWGKIQESNLLPTAYITWALLESNFKTDELSGALTYIKAHIKDTEDPYTLGIIANALVTADPKDPEVARTFSKLMEMKVEEEDKVYWKSKISTITFSHGDTANIETTAIIAYALIRVGLYPEAVNKVINYLIHSKDPYGTWHSTQATVMALKTLLQSVGKAARETQATMTISINDKKAAALEVTPATSDVLRQVELKEFVKKGTNKIRIELEGKGALLYQIVRKYYMPWKKEKPEKELLSIAVDYDRTELTKNDMVTCKVKITCERPGIANMVIVDLGVPPGFEVQAGDLEELVGSKVINKFNLTGREVIIYIEKLEHAKPIEFSYRLRAKFPIKAKTPESKVYEYYNPEVKAVAQPVELMVN